MNEGKIEIACHQLMDKNGQPYWMGNCEMDLNIYKTVLFVFPKPVRDPIEKEAVEKIWDILRPRVAELPDYKEVTQAMEKVFDEYFNARTAVGATVVIEPHKQKADRFSRKVPE